MRVETDVDGAKDSDLGNFDLVGNIGGGAGLVRKKSCSVWDMLNLRCLLISRYRCAIDRDPSCSCLELGRYI